jgi:hypothetical protein
MSRGDVYLHSNFPFSDGTFGKKFFVIIFEPKPESKEPYLVLKTTSKLKNQIYNIGCNQGKQAFYIPGKNANVFPIDTLIQLHEIFEFSIEEFLKGSLTDRTIEYKDTLQNITNSQLINCIKKLKEDISEVHYEMIMRQ